jgi:hypothetical protein
VKYFFLFILLPFTNLAYAQEQFPAGSANIFMLSDKDGYPGDNYVFLKNDSMGFSYSTDYNNNFCVSGNNFYNCTDTLRKRGGSIQAIYPLQKKECLVICSKNIYWFKNTSIIYEIALADELITTHSVLNKSYIFVNHQGKMGFHILENKNLSKLYETDFTINYVGELGNISLTIIQGSNSEIYLANKNSTECKIYKFDVESKEFVYLKNYTINNVKPSYLVPIIIDDENNGFFFADGANNRNYYSLTNGQLKANYNFHFANTTNDNSKSTIRLTPFNNPNSVIIRKELGKYYTGNIKNGEIKYGVPFVLNDMVNCATEINPSQYWGSTGNKPFRLFPYIKKYPTLFNNTNSASIFTVREDYRGRVWAGSYQGNLVIIENDKLKTVQSNGIMYMNGGNAIDEDMYFIGEGAVGIIKYDKSENLSKPSITSTGYYSYVSKDKKYFYYGTPGLMGLMQTTTTSLQTGKPVWNKIDTTKGSFVQNILTITEDTLGRIWYGHGRRSIAMYDPKKDKAQTWTVEKKETAFGAFSSITDKNGTVWIGSAANGLWYYSDYSKPASPKNFTQINHPLLNNTKAITALSIYNNWLIIANYDKIILLDIDSLYKFNKTHVRYLNPQEAALTSFTEQNTLITTKKDSTVWFSTSDMLYQWDIKKWLSLSYKPVQLFPLLSYFNKTDTLNTEQTFSYNPRFNSFSINLNYVSPDNLPRYISAVFLKEGDSLLLPPPSLDTKFNFNNLNAGNYNFVIKVYEMDGSIISYTYKIIIKKFLYQQWWFWLGIALLCIGIVAYLLNLKKKKQLAELAAKTKEAELETVKAEQAKKIANLQLVTLSSQFRPHFILNALNTIGAQMDDKPEAESVLSRLGESINIIFSHAQQQKIVHPFTNEWQLVENIIHIHRLMYLKQLQTDVPINDVLKKYGDIKVPLGILQIPIENALLHGLSNKESGPWLLKITIQENEHFIFIEITDNGVGRKKSAMLSNFTKHGTGTKNLTEIINIINASNPYKIMVEYKDDVFTENVISYGTTVIITLPKLLDYANQ